MPKPASLSTNHKAVLTPGPIRFSVDRSLRAVPSYLVDPEAPPFIQLSPRSEWHDLLEDEEDGPKEAEYIEALLKDPALENADLRGGVLSGTRRHITTRAETEKLMADFLNLAEATEGGKVGPDQRNLDDEARFARFANTYGPLGFCPHHGDLGVVDWFVPWRRAENCPDCSLHDGHNEPIAMWRFHARQFVAVLEVMSHLQGEGINRIEATKAFPLWAKDGYPRDAHTNLFGHVGGFFEAWFTSVGAPMPTLDWDLIGTNPPTPIANATIFSNSLATTLGSLLMAWVTSPAGFYQCSYPYCGIWYSPERIPRMDRRNFCGKHTKSREAKNFYQQDRDKARKIQRLQDSHKV